MVIDSHIHLYPEELSKDPESWAKRRGEGYWLDCVAPPKSKSLQAWRRVDELLADMDAAGVDKAIILSWYWESHDTCIESQAWLLNWTKDYPDRLIGFAPFNAKGGNQALELLRIGLDSGLRGIGELNPPAQGYCYHDEILASALELASEYDASVNFHVTDPTTHDYPGKIETPFASLLDLAKKHESTRFIFAHLGGLEPMRSEEDLPDNIFYDTAACPLLYKKPLYRNFCDSIGHKKVLFGTDYPLKVFPRNPNSPDFVTALEEIRNSGLDQNELAAVCGLNAKEIFNLS
ncbi:amidohydrolase family protein [Pelagicoccus albus]|uniref:Amidohydrolase family protein n=1 Tax=Pelagicoccus albus TaxID=415222 RepID=A0A7X1B5D4_9BACT|nr:amidohydrolase family protein [Pelagicoccus albus]MBC2604858.1 amidohydrolase family protein [Pelagicoccus albus]